MPRARDEASIRWLDTWTGREFERALDRVCGRYKGMDFWTDEQLAEIRAQMVQDAWFSHQINRQNRRRKVA
jgi:hypothetical protein